jgi:hypothetical protein
MYKVATPTKWVKVPNRQKKPRIILPRQKILQFAACGSPSAQLDHSGRTMSNVNIFTTSTGGKQARDEYGFT